MYVKHTFPFLCSKIFHQNISKKFIMSIIYLNNYGDKIYCFVLYKILISIIFNK